MSASEAPPVVDVLKSFDLRGRVAAITGAGGELCGLMAQALGGMGVRVAVLDLVLEKAEARAESIRMTGGEALALRCDVTHPSDVEDCYQSVCRHWAPPDLLINGAGGNDPRGSTGEPFHPVLDAEIQAAKGPSFFDLDPAGFRQVFDLNFLGTFLVCRAFARGMVERKSGAIVNISSMSALTPLTKVAAYSAAKAAVANFTRWLAVHFAHTGVRVNALAPGFFLTEQLRFLHLDPKTGELLPRARQVIAHTPMGRYGNPEDLLGTVVWLLSDASRFVTGVVVPVDGGFSSYSI
ncbi:MAG: SDR family oxidoreductase [Limisphaerales bacterium]